ncbi:MAG: hypothetical protein US11_C0001G0144 [Candidatus Roizmanbacteria bacterium GW2011_GWA2_36_23]|uniref:Uncharacterized protein n=1 Tax=Candidatus Roizmanbacteria bacterium GW2011_GWA2_36_23 TaxID=1618480 RepID=A0A0G0EM47_9BACT|nr:MAG: hypothetical protein US11_C0001G0144 [Candidatus Roizmanbacteria bacterium GW2011_GWA2_36_23]
MIGSGIVALILLLAFLFVFRPKNEKQLSAEPSPTSAVILTIDSSVVIDLISSGGGKEAILTISNIPDSTVSIDYELSYQTKQQGLQGVIGTITLDNEKEYEKKLTLGTCSSGSCVYHQVEGMVRVSLKFTGNYGDKIFEKEYKI